jgi:uncharacterized membrane protein YqjE
MSAWLSLPQAVPILLRHLLAYAELAEEDLQHISRRATGRLLALAVALLGAIFMLFMICVAVIAAVWDTPHRMAAILWLLGFFVLLTAGALYAALGRMREDTSMFAGVKKEWSQDRVILERLLNGHQPPRPPAPEQEAPPP